MKHRKAVEQLPAFAAGSLDRDECRALEVHLDGCADCRDWLETHRLLEQALGKMASGEKAVEDLPLGEVPLSDVASDDISPDEVAFDEAALELRDAPESAHPEASELALCAVRPEEVYEVGHSGLQEHLEQCAECRSDVETLREALTRARPVRDAAPAARSRRRSAASAPSRLALAASIAATLILGAWLLAPLFEGSDDIGPWPTMSPTETAAEGTAAESAGPSPETAPSESPSTPPSTTGPADRLADTELEGDRVIETEGEELTVNNVKIRDGARVTFRAGQVVAFGDGFQIGEGGSVSVEVRKHRRNGRPSG